MELMYCPNCIFSGERPYKCHLPDCGRAFIQLSNLQQHLRNHDAQVERAKNRPFHCNICGKGFATESSLRTHTSKVSLGHWLHWLADFDHPIFDASLTPPKLNSQNFLYVFSSLHPHRHQSNMHGISFNWTRLNSGATAASWCLAAACGTHWWPQCHLMPCVPQTLFGHWGADGSHEACPQREDLAADRAT